MPHRRVKHPALLNVPRGPTRTAITSIAAATSRTARSACRRSADAWHTRPELRDALIWRRQMACQLIGPTAVFRFEHALTKPAGGGAPAPWYQVRQLRCDIPMPLVRPLYSYDLTVERERRRLLLGIGGVCRRAGREVSRR